LGRARSALAAAALAVPFAIGTAAGSTPDGEVVCRFLDPQIIESSGLVATGDLLVTTNDSGDTGRVFAVDPDTCETVGVTTWSDDPTDVEALAPAGKDAVWVGDIGDNPASRKSIEVTRVPVGRSDREVDEETYDLTYPGGPVDAESLLSDPTTSRLYVATKEVFGGTLYAVPAHLSADGDNLLRPLGRITGIATDGAFLPDGRHLVLRTYTDAVVYAFPSLHRVGSFALPAQEQGEGIAIGADGAVYLSSEGKRAPVRRVELPASIRGAMAGSPSGGPSGSPTTVPSESSSGSPTDGPTEGPAEQPAEDSADPELWPWLAGLALFAGAVVVLVRSLRPR